MKCVNPEHGFLLLLFFFFGVLCVLLLLFVCAYVCVPRTSVNLSSYPWKPEEGIIPTGAVFTGSCELPDMGARN